MQSILKGIPTTAEDWQLYTHVEGAEEAAQKIAQALSDAVRANFTADIAFDDEASNHARRNVIKEVYKVMQTWAEFGAIDSEPLHILDDLVVDAFPFKAREI